MLDERLLKTVRTYLTKFNKQKVKDEQSYIRMRSVSPNDQLLYASGQIRTVTLQLTMKKSMLAIERLLLQCLKNEA